MFTIEKAPTGVTTCNMCGEYIKLHDTRVTLYGWSNVYFHKNCAKKALQAGIIALENDDMGYLWEEKVNRILADAGVID